jgi:hypothetical protein
MSYDILCAIEKYQTLSNVQGKGVYLALTTEVVDKSKQHGTYIWQGSSGNVIKWQMALYGGKERERETKR